MSPELAAALGALALGAVAAASVWLVKIINALGERIVAELQRGRAQSAISDARKIQLAEDFVDPSKPLTVTTVTPAQPGTMIAGPVRVDSESEGVSEQTAQKLLAALARYESR